VIHAFLFSFFSIETRKNRQSRDIKDRKSLLYITSIMNYLIMIPFLLLFIRIINTIEYDDDEKQIAFHSSRKYNSIFHCLVIPSYPKNIVD
jgi:hypothetical protein